MPNRIDVQEIITASGNSEPLDTSDLGQVSFTADVSSLTGSGAYVQVELQASDDGINFNVVHDTKRFITNSAQRISGIRISSKYYRYVWFVGGSSPSANLKISTTLKNYSPVRTGSMFRYADLDLKTLNATSTMYNSFTNDTLGIIFVREDSLADIAQIRLQVSNDSIYWIDASGDIPVAPNGAGHRCMNGMSHRFFRLIVTGSVTNSGTSTIHAFWSSTGGA